MLALLLAALCLLSVSLDAAPSKLTPISMPALGRQFSLGVLYDRRREAILEGPRLWTEDELRNVDTVPSYSTMFQIVASSNIGEDLSHFDLHASLKMAFLSGMVDVKGSAGYLDDRKKKNRVARVSLGYKSMTFKKTLAPELFLKITFPEVLKKTPEATDVVVAIQYGAGAIFTFDRALKSNEKMRDIAGKLAISVQKLPSFSVNGTGDLNITQTEKKEMEKFSCTFHGDFILKKHPGTYDEAIEVYKELPSLLGKNYQNSVPVRVWLYPIEDLPVDRATQVVHDISESLVSVVTEVINELESLTRDSNDILYSSEVAPRHQRIHQKVRMFKQYVERYALNFKQDMLKVLPKIRSGELPISELTKLITKKEASPFSHDKLQQWLEYFKEEVKVLEKIQSLPNYCRNDGDFSAKLLNDVKYTVGLTLQLGTMDDPYLGVLEKYLEGENSVESYAETAEKWFSPGSEVLSDLYLMSNTFNDFYQRIKKKKETPLLLTDDDEADIQFLVREKIMTSGSSEKKGVKIELYDYAILKDADYQLATAAGKPRLVSKTHENVNLEWTEPKRGLEKIKHYKVDVYIAKEDGGPDDCQMDMCKINSITTSGTKLMIIGLKAHASYSFTVSTMTSLGETSVSLMSDKITTDKCPLGMFHSKKHECSLCPIGTFSSVEGLEKCNNCPHGTFGTKQGLKQSSDCTACPKGTYNTKEGSKTHQDCAACPKGTFSNVMAADHVETCLKCPSGTFGDAGGLAVCKQCEKNTYNEKTGQFVCEHCPTGTHTDNKGAVSVTECIGVDTVTVAKKKIADTTEHVEKTTKELSNTRNEIDSKLTTVLHDITPMKEGYEQRIRNEVASVLGEMNTVHNCKWQTGEGSSLKSRFIVKDVFTREECIFKCMQYRKNNPYVHITGVTRKLSTKVCMCVEDLVKAASMRYEYCLI